MTFDCVEKSLRWLFLHHVKFVTKYPLPFLIIPALITVGLSVGIFVSLTKETDPETLYGPEKTQSRQNRVIIEDLYSEVFDENMLARHKTRLGIWGQVIITPNNGNNVLTVPVLTEILRLHDAIMNITIAENNISYTFTDLCIKWNSKCLENELLALLHYNPNEVTSSPLTYPLHSNPSGEMVFLGAELGEVATNTNGTILIASAIQLTYNLRYNTDEEFIRGSMWEETFLTNVDNFQTSEITVYRIASHSFATELDESSAVTLDLVAIVGLVVVSFAILCSSSSDWVRTKPLLASLGVTTAGLALASTFGLLSFAGVPYANVAGSMPFLILGIGVDDMFIMMAAWRQTSVYKSTKDRMRDSFQEAALSITITSITDIVAFGIGCISNFYSIRLMCIYAAISVAFAYVFFITFFAACMVIFGYREEQNRHAITLRKVLPKEEAASKAYYLFCAGGNSKSTAVAGNEIVDDAVADTPLMIFFRDYYGPFLTHDVSAAITVLIYMGYLAVAIWGFIYLEEGFDYSSVANEDSYLRAYYDTEQVYFKHFGPDMSIVAIDELAYWDADVQVEFESVMSELEASEYFYDSSLTISWLREFIRFLDFNGITQPSQQMFLHLLRDQFLTLPVYEQFTPDIVFDSNNDSIISSRFYMIGKNLNTSTREKDMFLKIRSVVANSDLNLVAYHPIAPWLLEQYIAIRQNTILTLSIGVAAMFVISLVLIPHPICSLIVTLAVVSVVFGVLGYMSHWSIPLDSTSMISLILALGFSVDYSAHISYGFITASKETRRERSIFALYSLGAPTIQGAVSTILAVVVLSTSSSYIYRTFFKTMLIVIFIGAVHGLVFLPVFLMIFVPVKARHVQNDIAAADTPGYKEKSVKNGKVNSGYFDHDVDGQDFPSKHQPTNNYQPVFNISNSIALPSYGTVYSNKEEFGSIHSLSHSPQNRTNVDRDTNVDTRSLSSCTVYKVVRNPMHNVPPPPRRRTSSQSCFTSPNSNMNDRFTYTYQ